MERLSFSCEQECGHDLRMPLSGPPGGQLLNQTRGVSEAAAELLLSLVLDGQSSSSVGYFPPSPLKQEFVASILDLDRDGESGLLRWRE